MWTTSPEIAKYLANREDGYIYTKQSNRVLEWCCPVCGNTFTKAVNQMYSLTNKCPRCDIDCSYPEKYVMNFLEQCCVTFDKEKTFEWAGEKRYDFYVPEASCIIEAHGKQHYVDTRFGNCDKNLSFEIYNDTIKRDLALQSGEIRHYIELDCRNSDSNWIKKSILESDLPFIFNITMSDIDWMACDEFAMSNLTKEIWTAYNSGITDINKLCKIFRLSKTSVRDKLSKGHKIGRCSYDSKLAAQVTYQMNGERVVKTMSKKVIGCDPLGNIIKEYNSIQEAQRELHIHHIWDCIVGKRKTAGGYIWKYKETQDDK